MIKRSVVTIVLLLVALVLGPAACDTQPSSVSSPSNQVEYSVELVHGTLAEGAAVAMYQATTDECAEDPKVFDTRPEGHSSLSVLPRLHVDDYGEFQAFYKFKDLDQYGCMRAGPGQRYWDLAGIELKCGPAVLQPQVFEEDGTSVLDRGILMFLHWPGAEPYSVVVDPPYSQYGVAGFTEGGDIGWGYSGEGHIGLDGGPFMVWASSDPEGWSDRVVGSDALADVGWWDDHCTPNPLFRLVRKAGSAPSSGDGYELVDYDEAGNEIGHIPFQVDTPITGVRILGLRLDGVDVGYVEWGDAND